MTEHNHPITPPPELVQQWASEWMRSEACRKVIDPRDNFMAARAAQWGADMELEACCELAEGWPSVFINDKYVYVDEVLRAARRPKPPSLKEKALEQLDSFQGLLDMKGLRADTIRQALEQLPDS